MIAAGIFGIMFGVLAFLLTQKLVGIFWLSLIIGIGVMMATPIIHEKVQSLREQE